MDGRNENQYGLASTLTLVIGILYLFLICLILFRCLEIRHSSILLFLYFGMGFCLLIIKFLIPFSLLVTFCLIVRQDIYQEQDKQLQNQIDLSVLGLRLK